MSTPHDLALESSEVKRRTLLCHSYLILLAVACLTLGSLGLLNSVSLWGHESNPIKVLMPETSLAIAFFGLALGCRLLGASRLSLVWALPLLGLGIHGLLASFPVMDQLPRVLRSDGNHMSAIFLLQSIALTASAFHNQPMQRLATTLGWLLLALGIFTLALGWLPMPELLHGGVQHFAHHQASSVGSLYISASGLAIIILPKACLAEKGKLGKLPLAAGVVGTLFVCSGWLAYSQQSLQHLTTSSEHQLAQLQASIKHELNDHVQLLERQALRWEALGEFPPPPLWRQEMESYLSHFPAFNLIGVFSHQLEPLMLKATQPLAYYRLSHFFALAGGSGWLSDSPGFQAAKLSPVLRSGERQNLLIAFPLQIPTRMQHWLIANLDVTTLFEQLHEHSGERFVFQVQQGRQPLFSFAPHLPMSELLPIGEKSVTLADGHHWRLISYMSKQHLKRSSIMPTITLVGGLLFSYLLTVSLGLLRLTERRREELAQNQRLFRIVGDTALIGGWYIDLLRNRAVWSKEVCVLHDEPADFQPTVEEAIAYYPAHCHKRLFDCLEACKHDGTPFDEEVTVTTGRGREITVRILGQAVRDANGDIVQIQGSTQDITEQKQLRQEVSRLATRLTRTLESMTVAFLTLDDKWRFSYLNNEAERLLAHKRADLLGHVVWECFPEVQGTRFETEYRLAVEQGRPMIFEEYSSRLMAWFEVHAYPTEEGLAVYFQDVSTRKVAEKRLRVLERSVESSINGVTIVDASQPDLPIIYVNAAFERMTGYSRDEIIGQNCRILQGEGTAKSARNAIRKGISGHRDIHVVIRNYRRDGSPFWNELYISPVRDDEGNVTHFIGVQNDITSEREYRAQLTYSATHDALTGLANRASIEKTIHRACEAAALSHRHLAVLILDLDDFKPINNTLGHETGDNVLIEVSRRLERQLRPEDSLARFGGDEFVLVLPNLLEGKEECARLIEPILAEIACPYHIDANELYLTASVGVSLYSGGATHPQALLQQADLAMYQAKQKGRNTYHFFSSDLNEKVSQHLSIRNELQRALVEGQFELHYQPQVHGPSGRILGFEALLRWKHPQKGYLSPAYFIDIAESTGQIVPISDWVLETACRANKRLNELGHEPYVMSVNVSPLQFQRSCFVPEVLQVIESTGLDASLLELELTENILMGSTDNVIETLHEIRSHGIGIAIDDFGTGFSSLSYLKYLPINKIKIDRSFIKDVISDHRDAAIIQGVASIATQLQLRVVAEGVETQAQYGYLQKHLCENFQGYYFAPPMPLEELITFLDEHYQAQNLGRKQREGHQGGQTLLLLDDEANILRALKRVLRRDGYRVLTTTSAQEAFELLATETVQVIISDQRMPEMSGTEFLRRAKELYPDTVQIVLSGYTDLKTITEAINESAIYKFLTKPWDDEELRLVVQQAFRHYAKQRVRRRSENA
ncbi:EAL domain-containing protein [Halomonas sp. MCCC 1A11057]|nr:EAL domain-containing protein [Halomonas sp. MCCC 1A11057]MCE8032837.1 EAL domain-containing protein [Halomonas sp. MCCC 1A11057]